MLRSPPLPQAEQLPEVSLFDALVTSDVNLPPYETAVELAPAVAEFNDGGSRAYAQTAWIQRTLRGGAWVLGARILTILCTVTTQFVLTHTLSKAEYGQFNVLTMTTLFVSILMMGGMNFALVRLVAERLATNSLSAAAAVMRRGLAITFLMTAVVGAAGYALLTRFAPLEFNTPQMRSLLIAGAVIMALQQVLAEALRGMHDLKGASLFGGGQTNGAVTSLFLVALLTAAVMAGATLDLHAASIYYVAAIGLTLPIVAVCWWRQYRTFLSGRFATPETSAALASAAAPNATAADVPLPALLRIALPLMLIHLLGFLQTQADLWIAQAYFQHPDELGLYSAARWVINIVGLPVTMVNLTISASIADLKAQGKTTELQSMLRKSVVLAGIPSVLALAGIVLFPNLILSCFGDYGAARGALLWLAVGQFCFFMTGSAGITLIMTGHELISLALNFLCAAVTVLLGSWAAWHYGLNGMAAVTAIDFALLNLAQWWFVWRLEGVWTHFSWATAGQMLITFRRRIFCS